MDEINQQETIFKPKKNYLPLIIIIVFFTINIILTCSILNLQKQISDSNKRTPIIETDLTPEPTLIPIITIQPTQISTISYKVTSVQDDKNSVSKLILTDENNKETIITESNYQDMPEINIIIKTNYSNFVFSSDNNFLYFESSKYESSVSSLYDIRNKKIIDLDFIAYNAYGFTSDSKYFYACAENGMDSGGAIVKRLSTLNDIFSRLDENFDCQYNQNEGKIIFSEIEYENQKEGDIVSQYEFFQDTETILKTK